MSDPKADTALTSAVAAVTPKRRIPGLRKAAIFLVTVGDEMARKLMTQLPENDVQRVTEEIAELMLYLAGDRSAYVTGAVFSIDGGITAACPVASF